LKVMAQLLPGNDISVFQVVKIYGDFLLSFWWLWLPLFLFFIFFQTWMYYIQRQWRASVPFVLLEIKPPKEIEQSPKITEAIFAAIWSISGTVSTKLDKYLKGMTQHFMTFELVGISGEIKFLVRTPAIYRNLIEGKIYAEYPKAEISEVEDYVDNLPTGVLDRDWDLWGTVMQLAKENAYPLRTYNDFIDILPKQPFIDPISTLMEALAKLRPGEQVWIQIFARPAADSWIADGKKIVSKIMGKPEAKKQGIIGEITSGWGTAFQSVLSELASGKPALPAPSARDQKPELPSMMMHLSPGEKEIIEEIEKKMAKKAFECKINLLYFGKRDLFFKPTVSTIMGFFNQFATLNLNALRPNPRFTTKAFYAMAGKRLAFKKRVILRLCRQRTFWDKGFILNIEELASLWHFPTISVQAPMMPQVEAKKGTPPAELPLA